MASKKIQVVTHSGPFHADEIFAIACLRAALGADAFDLTRTRDAEAVKTADIAVDVGAEYDPARGRFDHHQGAISHPVSGAPAAAAGLVWAEYGKEACGGDEAVAELVYQALIRIVDAYDCGKLPCEGQYTVSNMLGSFNPSWNDPGQDFDGKFMVALAVAEDILSNEIRRAEGQVAAEAIAEAAIESATDGGRLVTIDRFAPIMERLISTAAEFMVYPGPGGDCWMVQAVPPSIGSFAQKNPLPASWAGKRDKALQAEAGVADAVFCHPGRFIAGAASREGALALARLALANQPATV